VSKDALGPRSLRRWGRNGGDVDLGSIRHTAKATTLTFQGGPHSRNTLIRSRRVDRTASAFRGDPQYNETGANGSPQSGTFSRLPKNKSSLYGRGSPPQPETRLASAKPLRKFSIKGLMEGLSPGATRYRQLRGQIRYCPQLHGSDQAVSDKVLLATTKERGQAAGKGHGASAADVTWQAASGQLHVPEHTSS